ncbi:MAG TPA: hypothetical protein VEX63_07275 [Flavisolibacter sp.]|jgi:hypothetical protein|nr:hypothetical protein [Flavisolibacter sp.]
MKPTLTTPANTDEKKVTKLPANQFSDRMIKAVAEKQDFEKKVLELLKEYASKKPAGIFY